jgi:cell pole-organizing protein PopZ
MIRFDRSAAGTWQLVTRAADVTMAQAGSAQREPSMEEILASIRRIIEDSDTGRKPHEEAEAGRTEHEASSGGSAYEPAQRDVAPARGEGAVIEVDAFRAELRAPASAPEPRKPVTLAEVQAQIAADARKRAGESMPAAEPVRKSPPEPDAVARREWASPAPSASPVVAEAEGDAKAAAPSDEVEAEQVSSAVAEEPGKAVAAAAGNGVARSAIISEQASRQVAAAFGELSEAFSARSKKTFDEMAEEMMRPMLQDWLDNNLPTLVERLVREEIERVARGAS